MHWQPWLAEKTIDFAMCKNPLFAQKIVKFCISLSDNNSKREVICFSRHLFQWILDFGIQWLKSCHKNDNNSKRQRRGYIKGLYCPILTFFCCIGKGITWEHKDNIKHMLSPYTYRVSHMDGPKTKVHFCWFFLLLQDSNTFLALQI